MYPFLESSVRLKISTLLEQFSKIPNRQKITMRDVDLLIENITKRTSNSINLMEENAGKELSIAYFGSLIISIMAITMADSDKPHPMNPNWLNPENTPDPNLILEGLLVNIANQCFSIISLATLGFTWPARILLRSTLEISWLTVVLISNREKMLAYCEGLDDESERKQFHKHFSGSKLLKELKKIEKELQFDEGTRELYSNARAEAYDFYTKHVHNSYAATLFGTRAPSFDDPKILEYALYSTPSIPARGVISSLNQQVLFYVIGVLLPCLKSFHAFPIVELWDDLVTLRECFVQLYVQLNSR